MKRGGNVRGGRAHCTEKAQSVMWEGWRNTSIGDLCALSFVMGLSCHPGGHWFSARWYLQFPGGGQRLVGRVHPVELVEEYRLRARGKRNEMMPQSPDKKRKDRLFPPYVDARCLRRIRETHEETRDREDMISRNGGAGTALVVEAFKSDLS